MPRPQDPQSSCCQVGGEHEERCRQDQCGQVDVVERCSRERAGHTVQQQQCERRGSSSSSSSNAASPAPAAAPSVKCLAQTRAYSPAAIARALSHGSAHMSTRSTAAVSASASPMTLPSAHAPPPWWPTAPLDVDPHRARGTRGTSIWASLLAPDASPVLLPPSSVWRGAAAGGLALWLGEAASPPCLEGDAVPPPPRMLMWPLTWPLYSPCTGLPWSPLLELLCSL